MGGLKKSKGGKGKGGSKPKDGRPKEPKKQQPQQDEFVTQLPPQERVQAVRPFWETQSHEQRVDLLSIDIDELRARAKELTIRQQKQAALEAAEAELSDGQPLPINLEPTPEEILEEGIKRLQDKSTWKVWQWPLGSKEFFDADSFRRCVEEEHIEEDLRKLLPKDEGKPVEKPAEQQLRLRMTELLQKVHASTRALHDDVNGSNPKRSGRGQRVTPDQIHTAVRDTNIELITMMLEALEHEHEYLYHAVLFPITSYVCEMLPETMRDSTRSELFFEDLEKLPPDEVARICEWLTEKVDGFGAKIKPEAKDIVEEEEEEGIGDVDLFTLTEDGSKLMVNAKWLQHLQERLLGEDGHPRKVKDGEDPYNMGLVLEWVYGTIVSTAEKARDGAKRALGMRSPTAQQAHDQLMSALQDHQSWELRSKQAKELLKEMLGSRKEAAELATRYDIRPLPTKAGGSGADVENNELPDHVIISMLKHEVLLTRSKLHALNYEHHVGERKLRSLKSQLRQGEPEFERLKRELEEVKNQPRGLEGTFRTAAEMERHRAQLADAAIEEQLEVQTAFREHGSRLQGIYDNRQRTELEMARREQEMKQLQGWKATVQSLIERIEELTATHDPAEGDVEEGGQAATPDPDSEAEPASAETSPDRQDSARALMTSAQLAGQGPALVKLRAHFQKDVRRQLYTSEDDKTFYDWIQRELGQVEKKLDEGRAVLQHLEMQLINVACDDPGAAIGAQLALPILQERLDAKALEFAGKRAAEAEEALTKMEEENAERARLEREKKLKAKAKAKEKVRGEKERLAAEKAAQEAAERTASEQAALLRKQQEEEERKRRLQELEELRKAEEALMEARRKELLSEENGYWRRRMAQEQALQEHVVADSSGQDDLSETDADWVANGGEAATSKDAERRQQAQRTRRKRADWQDGEDMSDGSAAQDKHPMGNGIPHKAYRDGRDRDRDGRFPGSDPRDREDSRRYSSRSTPHSRGSRDERDNWGDGSGRRHGEHGRYGGENGRFSDAQPNGPVPAGGAMPQYPGSYPQHAVPSHAPSTPPAMPAGRGVGSAVPMMPFPHPGAPVAHMMGQPPQMGAPQQMPNGGPYLVPYFPVPGMAIGMPAQLGDPSHGHPMGPGMQHMPNQPATHMQGPQGFGSPGAGSMLPQQGGQLPSPKGPLEHIETSESSAQVTVEERAQQAASVASAASSSSAQTRFGPDAPSWRHGHVLELPTADTATSSPSVSATDSPVSTSARGPGPDGRASPDPQRAATLAATSASGQAPRWSAIAAKEGAAGRPQPNGGMGTRSGSFGRLADSSGPRPQPSKALQGPQAPTEAQRQQRAAAREQTAWSSARSAAANGPTAAAPSARPPSASAATPAAGSAPAQMMPAERQVSPATTSAASTRTAGDKRKVMKAGGVVWEGLQDDMKRLKLVRGLSNDSGQYNCFLNVIIQSLWHLRSFREALLRLDPAGLERRGAGPGDVRVLRALWNIFHAFAHSPDDVPPDSEMAALDGLEDAGADQDAKRAKRDPADGKGWTVSPIELREALSSLDKGRVAVQFELTEMHDASEVLGEIFNCMHRAELGGLPEGAVDAQLPHRVKIRTGPASPAAAGMQPAMVLPSYASANGVSTAGGGVIPHTPMAAQAQPSARSSMVQDLFGLDVQVPCPADEDEDESAVKKARGSGGAVVGRWRMQQSKAQQAQQARAAPAGPKKPKDPNVTEVLQYMKYFHLVPAQGLQLAYNTLLDGSFEEMLQHAEAADALAHKSGGAGSVANGGLAGPDITLLRPPRVFNLAIVWDSPQAPADAISSTVDALGNALDLSRVFKGLPTAQRYSLRCVICYFGHHYQAYALSEELDLWLLFDDTNIKLIGDWRDVAFSMRKSRLQPSVLFYERR
ncbi:hypothetical protein WJX72_001362 [[Myrmecia] bisecta]|uniref:USP domain-containing protein n=1 Tax=[Myrmecia] bisecta TaxID=41462 RepID=A0AAW1P8M0_9CHLO